MTLTIRTDKCTPPRIVRFALAEVETAAAVIEQQWRAGELPKRAAEDLLDQVERVARVYGGVRLAVLGNGVLNGIVR